MSKTVRLFIFMLVALSLVLAACGAPAEEAPAVPAETEAAVEVEATEGVEVSESEFPEPADVTGDIITAGSSTVFPVSERMAELFQQEGYKATSPSIASAPALVSNASASRVNPTSPTPPAPSKTARRKPANPSDANRLSSALVRRPGCGRLLQNDFITHLLEDLAKIFSGEIKNWNELDASLPRRSHQGLLPRLRLWHLRLLRRSRDGPAYENGEEALLGLEGVQLSEDDNVLVQGVAGDKYAIGYFGYAYYVENADKLNALNVNDVEPSQANVDNGTYPWPARSSSTPPPRSCRKNPRSLPSSPST
jgi:phosphate transport system substrate-binding protein